MTTEMENPLISIIIPVYNQEKLLGKCLDSLMVQTYRNIEIIVVDDGSTDQSGLLCDEYAKRDLRIKAFHQDNKGISGARNLGISHMHGTYVAFVDSDDLVSEKYISHMYNILIANHSDIVICDFCVAKNGNEPYSFTPDVTNMSGEEACAYRLTHSMKTIPVVYAKLFRAELIRKVPFPDVTIAEDLSVIFKIMYLAHIITINNSVIYRYYVGNSSMMRSDFTERNIICNIRARKAIYEFFLEEKNAKLEDLSYRMYYEKLLIAYSLTIDGAIDGDCVQLKKNIKNEINKAYPATRKLFKKNRLSTKEYFKMRIKFFVARYFSFILRRWYGKKYIHRF